MNACSSSTRVFCLKHGLTLIEGAPRGTYRWLGVLSIDLAQNQPGLGPNRLDLTQTGTYRPIYGFGLI
jgi:hypothetical protein